MPCRARGEIEFQMSEPRGGAELRRRSPVLDKRFRPGREEDPGDFVQSARLPIDRDDLGLPRGFESRPAAPLLGVERGHLGIAGIGAAALFRGSLVAKIFQAGRSAGFNATEPWTQKLFVPGKRARELRVVSLAAAGLKGRFHLAGAAPLPVDGGRLGFVFLLDAEEFGGVRGVGGSLAENGETSRVR